MSTELLTEPFSPFEFARRERRLHGEVPLPWFARVAEIASAETPVSVVLEFGFDEEGRCRVTGALRARLRIVCERCAESVAQDMVADVDLRVVARPEEASEITPALDAFLLDTGEVTVVELVEDDILLNLPKRGCAVPAKCPSSPPLTYPARGVQDDEDETDAVRTSPFQVLERMKPTRGSGD